MHIMQSRSDNKGGVTWPVSSTVCRLPGIFSDDYASSAKLFSLRDINKGIVYPFPPDIRLQIRLFEWPLSTTMSPSRQAKSGSSRSDRVEEVVPSDAACRHATFKQVWMPVIQLYRMHGVLEPLQLLFSSMAARFQW